MTEHPPRPKPLRCRSCNYDLSGLPADSTCPECNEPIANSVGWKDNAHTTAMAAFFLAVCTLFAAPCIGIFALALWGWGAALAIDAYIRSAPGPRNRTTRTLAAIAIVCNLLPIFTALIYMFYVFSLP